MPTLAPPVRARLLAQARLLPQAGPAAVFVSAWAFRFLTMGSVENDHFVALARAHQILLGAWPVRDFFDPGQPLAYLASAVLAAIAGRSLLTEVLFATTMLAVAATVTFALARRASGSVLIALAAAAAEVAAYPRLYNAGKLLIPLMAIWLGWRYADRQTVARLAALAGWTAIAFLWRHDLGIFVAAPAMVLLFYHHAPTPLLTRRIVQYLLLCVAFLLPWVAYVQWAAGLDVYLASASRFVAVEAKRTGRPDHIALVCLVAAIPLVAIGFAKRLASPLTFAHIAFVATMALLVDIVFLRDALAARLPDVAGVSVVLLAWLAGRAPQAVARVTAVIAAAAAAAGVVVMLAKQGYGIPTPGAVVRRAVVTVDHLYRASADAVPDPELLPIVDYLASCTPATEHVLVSGFAPQIPVLANRPFAAGLPTWLAGYYTSDADVERARATLSREAVSVVVLLEGEETFTTEWPRLAADLRARGLVERAWPLGDRMVTVWLPASRAPGDCKNEGDRLHEAVSRP